MQHLYYDVSDLDTPYDQWGSALPLQGLGVDDGSSEVPTSRGGSLPARRWACVKYCRQIYPPGSGRHNCVAHCRSRSVRGLGAHVYEDYSNLNAEYDRARPAIHGLGGGSLGGSSLGTMSNNPIGIGAVPSECSMWTEAHYRRERKLPAQDGDAELIAQWDDNTEQWGCPIYANGVWFWPGAPMGQWRVKFNYWVSRDGVLPIWEAVDPDTWMVPPWILDAGRIAQPGAALLSSPVIEPLQDEELGVDFTVSELQRILNAHLQGAGCQALTVDGNLGPTTCGATKYVIEELWQAEPELKAMYDGGYIADVAHECQAKHEPYTYSCSRDLAPQARMTRGGFEVSQGILGMSTGTAIVAGAVTLGALLVGGSYVYKRYY